MTGQVLDITRTVSRVGRGHPTGIDRVERAYIREFLRRFTKPLFLAKLTNDFIVIDGPAMAEFVDAGFGVKLNGPIGVYDALRLKLPKKQRRARAFLRGNAKWHFRQALGVASITQNLPNGFEYTNVGHSNLDSGFLSLLKPAGCTNIRVMIHDMIPLDFPQYCKPDTPQAFRKKMQAVAAVVDQVICNSEYTRTRVREYFQNWPNSATYRVVNLAVEPHFKRCGGVKSTPASFVVLGTIEPRKNHDFLLDVWEDISRTLPEKDVPILHIIGKRGWENTSFFDRLVQSAMYGTKVVEHNSLNDKDLNAILSTARALLFPSFAEGYGLPALEAMAAGIPVICSDIPVFRELLKGQACLLPTGESGKWAAKVIEISRQNATLGSNFSLNDQKFEIPCWTAHFRHIFAK